MVMTLWPHFLAHPVHLTRVDQHQFSAGTYRWDLSWRLNEQSLPCIRWWPKKLHLH